MTTTSESTEAGKLVRSMLQKALQSPPPQINESVLKEAILLSVPGNTLDSLSYAVAKYLACGGDLKKQANVTQDQIASYFKAAQELVSEVTGKPSAIVSEVFKPNPASAQFSPYDSPGQPAGKVRAEGGKTPENTGRYDKPAKLLGDPEYTDSRGSFSNVEDRGQMRGEPTGNPGRDVQRTGYGTQSEGGHGRDASYDQSAYHYGTQTSRVSATRTFTGKALAKMLSSDPQATLRQEREHSELSSRDPILGDLTPVLEDPVKLAMTTQVQKILDQTHSEGHALDKLYTKQIKDKRDSDLTKGQ